MHIRNTRKKHGPIKVKQKKNAEQEQAREKVTNKQRKARIKQLSEAIANFELNETSIFSTELLRHVLKHLYEYPKLARKLYEDDICLTPVTKRLDLATMHLQRLQNHCTRHQIKLKSPLPQPEQLVDDLYHVIKIMHRYKLNFDQAFNYRLMNIALRGNFAAKTPNQPYVPKVYADITLEALHQAGRTVGLKPEQITPLIPCLQQKIILGTQRHLLKNGLFNNENHKQTELARIENTVKMNLTPK